MELKMQSPFLSRGIPLEHLHTEMMFDLVIAIAAEVGIPPKQLTKTFLNPKAVAAYKMKLLAAAAEAQAKLIEENEKNKNKVQSSPVGKGGKKGSKDSK